MLGLIIFILGLVVGSFLNVCIYRLPRNESIITPRSHCPYCSKTIPWYDNIPLLSFLLLGGKCRFCRVRISPLYFIVELLTALLFVLFLNFFGLNVSFIVYTALACSLVVITFVDLKIEEIPDEITIPGMFIGLVLSFSFPQLMREGMRFPALLNSFLGLLAGGLSIYLMGALGKFLFKREAMGGGDVKLMAMIGTILGWRLVILVFFLAPFFGSVVGIILKIKQNREVIPYGPYLSLATIIIVLWGNEILGWISF